MTALLGLFTGGLGISRGCWGLSSLELRVPNGSFRDLFEICGNLIVLGLYGPWREDPSTGSAPPVARRRATLSRCIWSHDARRLHCVPRYCGARAPEGAAAVTNSPLLLLTPAFRGLCLIT